MQNNCIIIIVLLYKLDIKNQSSNEVDYFVSVQCTCSDLLKICTLLNWVSKCLVVLFYLI